MSHWNYRILAHPPHPIQKEDLAIYLEIHEVYYEDDGTPGGPTANPVSVGGETVEEVGKVLEMMKAALEKPVLWYGDRWPEEYQP